MENVGNVFFVVVVLFSIAYSKGEIRAHLMVYGKNSEVVEKLKTWEKG